MKKALSFLLVLTLLLSAVSAFPFNTASAQEEDTTLKTDTYIPEDKYYPVVVINTIPDVGSDDPVVIESRQQMAMSLMLAHEIAHTLGLDEVYDDRYDHRDDNYTCIMETFVGDDVAYDFNYRGFYDKVNMYLTGSDEGAAPFCSNCFSAIEELLVENEPIAGN